MLISCGPVFHFTRFDFSTVHQWTVIHLSSYSNLCSHDFSPRADQNTLLTLTIFPFTKSFMPLQSGTESMMFASSTKRCLLWQNDWRSLFVGHDFEYSGDLMFAKQVTSQKFQNCHESERKYVQWACRSVTLSLFFIHEMYRARNYATVSRQFATRNDKEK